MIQPNSSCDYNLCTSPEGLHWLWQKEATHHLLCWATKLYKYPIRGKTDKVFFFFFFFTRMSCFHSPILSLTTQGWLINHHGFFLFFFSFHFRIWILQVGECKHPTVTHNILSRKILANSGRIIHDPWKCQNICPEFSFSFSFSVKHTNKQRCCLPDCVKVSVLWLD